MVVIIVVLSTGFEVLNFNMELTGHYLLFGFDVLVGFAVCLRVAFFVGRLTTGLNALSALNHGSASLGGPFVKQGTHP